MPPGNGDVVEMVNGPEFGLTVSENTFCRACGCGKHESAAVTVNRNDPKFVGVPESTPAVENVIPVGNTPDSVHEIGAMPPTDWNWNVYALPCVAFGIGDVLPIENAGHATLSVKSFCAMVPTESCT